MNLAREIRHALRSDPILAAVVGEDEDHEIKVYTPLAKANVQAPYITFSIVPSTGPISAYGDSEVIEPFRVAVTSWATGGMEVWQVADVADDALKRADYDFGGYELMFLNRVSTPQEFRDRDTNLSYIVVLYEIAIGR